MGSLMAVKVVRLQAMSFDKGIGNGTLAGIGSATNPEDMGQHFPEIRVLG
jgi:hypothetical protein